MQEYITSQYIFLENRQKSSKKDDKEFFPKMLTDDRIFVVFLGIQ